MKVQNLECRPMADAIKLRFGIDVKDCHELAPSLAEKSFAEMIRASRGLAMSGDRENVRAEFALGSGGVFASAFFDAIGTTVLEIYKQSRPNWRRWANSAEVPTLSGKRVNVDALESPPKVSPGQSFVPTEGGGRQSDIALGKYGRLLNISWEAILADDIGFILKLISEEINAAVRLEDDLVIAALAGATSFFLSANNNKLTGNALDPDGLKAAIAAIRVMQSGGGVKLRLSPRILLVPAALENSATGLLEADLIRGEDHDGTIIPVVDSRLDESSQSSWYLVSDKRQTDSIVLQVLTGSTGPELIELPRKLEFDGVRYRIKNICGAAAVNPYGIVKSEA